MALEAGISPFDFWGMTYGETIDVIKVKQKKELENMKFQALTAYRLSELITTGMGIVWGSKKAFPPIHETFPGLFEKPKLQKQPWQITKERIEAYAAAKRKQNGGEAN